MVRTFLKAGIVVAAAVASFSASAFALTLDTRALEANAKLTLSDDALGGLALAGISITPGGYARTLSTNQDPDVGIVGAPKVINLPITTFTADIKLLPPSLTPVKGSSVGSSLDIVGPRGSLSLANFTLDFKSNQVLADVITGAGTSLQQAVYSFTVTKPLTFNLKGGISIDESVGNMILTPYAVDTFGAALNLRPIEKAALQSVDFGTIDASIVPWFRKTPLSNATAAAVPEPSTYALLGLGLGVAVFAARRRQAAA